MYTNVHSKLTSCLILNGVSPPHKLIELAAGSHLQAGTHQCLMKKETRQSHEKIWTVSYVVLPMSFLILWFLIKKHELTTRSRMVSGCHEWHWMTLPVGKVATWPSSPGRPNAQRGCRSAASWPGRVLSSCLEVCLKSCWFSKSCRSHLSLTLQLAIYMACT